MQNRTTIILAVAVALLVVAAGVVLAGSGGQPAQQAATQTQQPQQQQQQAAAAGPPTVVPQGTKPADFVKAYYQAVQDGDYAKAFEMQPAASKAGGDAASFGTQQKSYGMKAFKMGKTSTQGNTTQVECIQDLGQNGTWISVWTFEKQGDKLIAQSKRTGMQ